MNPSAIGPSPAESWQATLSLHSSGQYAEALAGLDRLLEAEPSWPQALELASVCLHRLRRHDGTRAATPSPEEQIDHAAAYNDLGYRFYGSGRATLAERAFREALSIRPDWPVAMTNLGIALRVQHRYEEAEAILQKTRDMAPSYARARNASGLLLWNLKRLSEAEAQYREAIRLDPDFRDAHNNLGLLLMDLNRLPEAQAEFERALAIDPLIPEGHNNLGNALKQQGRTAAAIAAYRQALALRPDYPAAKANLALPLLQNGEYGEGWALYESRHDAALGSHYTNQPSVPWPRWNGEPLAGKSVLVWPEQGFGDVLQFCRYVGLLKARGAERVGIACQPALARLLESLEGVDAVYPLDGQSTIDRHDCWCFVMSLPYLLGTTVETIPATMPYVQAPAGLAQEWQKRLPEGSLRVGIVWAGDPRRYEPASNAIDQRRSMSARRFAPILRVPGVTFVSLQKGETTQRQIADLPPELRPFDPMDGVQDFADTAAIIECLDLVITVDTSMAHLAGALNKPVWILSRYDACWRWLGERSDSPWYPSARLFRQTRPGDWEPVIERVTEALAGLQASAAHP
jgi:Flp pilus assembly protein TadD